MVWRRRLPVTHTFTPQPGLKHRYLRGIERRGVFEPIQYLVSAGVTIATQSEVIWVFLGAGLLVWAVRGPLKRAGGRLHSMAWAAPIAGALSLDHLDWQKLGQIAAYFTYAGAFVFGSGLAIVPFLGAFVVWVPVAIGLALSGNWLEAVVLTVWGTVVVGLIDNILYPILVGKRLSLHPMLSFIAIIGGLLLFGAHGIVLGPLTFAAAQAVLHIWRSRIAPQRVDSIGTAPDPA